MFEPPFRKRIGRYSLVVLLLLILAFLFCIFLAVRLTFFPEEKIVAWEPFRSPDKIERATRGEIFDTNLNIIAQNVDTYDLSLDLQNIDDYHKDKINGKTGLDAILESLSTVNVKIDSKTISKIRDSKIKYLAGENISRTIKIKENISVETKNEIKSKLDLDIVAVLDLKKARFYPYGSYASKIIGTTKNELDDQLIGVVGLEDKYDSTLSGIDGEKYAKWDASGKMAIPGTEKTLTKKEDGKDIISTLDMEVQEYSEDLMNETIKKNGADYGIAIIQDVKTGEIVSIVDTNNPDPNKQKGRENIALNAGFSLINSISPGSTQKWITLTEEMNEGLANLSTHFYAERSETVDVGAGVTHTFQDAGMRPTNNLTLTGILAYSSNVGIYHSIRNLSFKKRYEYFKKLGYFENSGLEFPSEPYGSIYVNCALETYKGQCEKKPYELWDKITATNIMFGESINMPFLNQINTYSTIANGGKKVRASLIKGFRARNGTIENVKAKSGERIFKKQVTKDALKMLEGATKTGYEGKINSNYRIGVKSGTADEAGIGNSELHSQSIGVGPIDNPRYTIGVFFKFKSGSGKHYGSDECVPAFGKIMDFVLKHYKVKKSKQIGKLPNVSW